jgi:hypothetical protein
MRTIRPPYALANAIALATVTLFNAPQAGAGPVADIVEKYGLTGTWAADCAKPPHRQNPHVVYRLRDGDRLEREITIENSIFDVSIAASIAETGSGELTMAWNTREGGITNRVRADRRQMQVQDSTRDNGEKISANGRRTRDNAETPIFKKCAPPAA